MGYYAYSRILLMRNPCKIIKVGDSLALIIPAQVCRDLEIRRGDYFELTIRDRDLMVARRLKILTEENFGEARETNLPIVHHDE